MKFECSITISIAEENCPKNLGQRYYGFLVFPGEKYNFQLENTGDLEELKEKFDKLDTEISESEYTTDAFKVAISYATDMLKDIHGEDYAEGTSVYTVKQINDVYVSLRAEKLPEEKATPKPDGSVSGYLWDVCIGIPNEKTGNCGVYRDTAYCIKPESAVHEVLDRFFRKYPDLIGKIAPYVEVSKDPDQPLLKYDYVII